VSRGGSRLGHLHGLHAGGCDGQESSTCRPVVVPAGAGDEPTYMGRDRGAEIVVVLMAWCEECNAAEWEVV
jgi:hypothetical protein